MYLNKILNIMFNKMIMNNMLKKSLKQYKMKNKMTKNNMKELNIKEMMMMYNKKYSPSINQTNNKEITNFTLSSDKNNKDNKMLDVKLLLKMHNVQPIKYWINLKDNNTKKEIKDYLYKKQGIYYIGNMMTNEFYIGSAGFNNLYKRFTRHLYTLEGNTSIAKDMKMYGLNTFVYAILEINNNLDLDRNYWFNIEQIYLYNKLPTYNNDNLKAVFTNKLVKLNEVENKMKFMENNDIFGIYMYNYLTINRNMFNMMYNKYNNVYYNMLNNDKINKRWSKEGMMRILKRMSLSLGLYNMNNELICSFESRKVAAHLLGCTDRTIIRAIKGSGYMYIPNQFMPYLKDHFDMNSKPIINNLKTLDLEYISYRNKIHMIKATRYNLVNTTKVFIKDNIQK
uniref:GIY-YIG domain-containing protein n=1 Tax=Saccharomyces paradoxus TaxID=27291 RepID=A0A1W5RRN0_SACPA|nr:hypothetical protein [Saccharomyces paradoxus]AQX35963.1 hypothetical protein [Saccharomyces paradoxus]AQX36064.1 hypothetical protein [Saccharomyces paradoxus]AQX36091.1 hypothetical protein [Saccharomyces paradoxus]